MLPTVMLTLPSISLSAPRCQLDLEGRFTHCIRRSSTQHYELRAVTVDCHGLISIWKSNDGRAAWASLTSYYYGSESRETAIGAIIRKINGIRFKGEGSGQSYEKVTVKLRDCFQKLEAIGKDAAIFPAQQVIYLLKAIKANNNDLSVGISTVKSDLESDGKANDFEKAVSYLKNCVP